MINFSETWVWICVGWHFLFSNIFKILIFVYLKALMRVTQRKLWVEQVCKILTMLKYKYKLLNYVVIIVTKNIISDIEKIS